MGPKFGNMVRRWRPRFGLRAVFIVLTVVCVFLGTEVQRWRREVQALRELESQGAYVAYTRWFGIRRQMDDFGSLWLFESVTSVSFQHATDCGEMLAEFAELEVAAFDVDTFNDEELRVLYATQERLPHVFVLPQAVHTVFVPDEQALSAKFENLGKLRGLQTRLGLTDPRRK